MKKIISLFLVVMFVSLWVPMVVSGQDRPAESEKVKKGPDADKIISNMEARKAKILENIKLRFDKLNEKLATFDERINKMSERLSNAKSGKDDGKNADRVAKGENQLKERKEKVTARYNAFKKNIEGRKAHIMERLDNQKKTLEERTSKLSGDDKGKVMAAYEKMRSEVVAEGEKLAAEAMKRIEATYHKLMSL